MVNVVQLHTNQATVDTNKTANLSAWTRAKMAQLAVTSKEITLPTQTDTNTGSLLWIRPSMTWKARRKETSSSSEMPGMMTVSNTNIFPKTTVQRNAESESEIV